MYGTIFFFTFVSHIRLRCIYVYNIHKHDVYTQAYVYTWKTVTSVPYYQSLNSVLFKVKVLAVLKKLDGDVHMYSQHCLVDY